MFTEKLDLRFLSACTFSIILTLMIVEEVSFTAILRDSCKIYSGLLLYQSISEKQDENYEHDPEIASMLIEILSSLELMCENVFVHLLKAYMNDIELFFLYQFFLFFVLFCFVLLLLLLLMMMMILFNTQHSL